MADDIYLNPWTWRDTVSFLMLFFAWLYIPIAIYLIWKPRLPDAIWAIIALGSQFLLWGASYVYLGWKWRK